MEALEGHNKVKRGEVCKLKRSLYGLKQASMQWNVELTDQLTVFGFKQSMHDNYLFTMTSYDYFLALLVYFDGILLTGTFELAIQKVKCFLDKKFTIKDLNFAKYFLGLELTRSCTGLYVN